MKFIYLIVLFFISTIVYCQNNYWAQQYGAKSSMLGGAVVGGVRDNSAMYYNPGAVGFIENPNLNVSATVYGLEIISLKNAAGNNQDLNSTQPVVYPQIISGIKLFKKHPKWNMVYGLLTRHKTDWRMQTGIEKLYDVIPEVPGEEYYTADVIYQLNSIEQWFGLSFAYQVSNQVSLGITQFFSYIHINDHNSFSAAVDVSSDSVIYTARFQNLVTHTIDHFNALWKIGLAIDLNNLDLGFTVTTPSVSLFGFGQMRRSISSVNLNKYLPFSHPFGKYQTLLLEDYQNDLNTNVKTPFSLAAGATYHLKHTTFNVSIEYFLPIRKYEVLHGTDRAQIRPTAIYGGDTVPNFLAVQGEAVGVFNVGFGVSQDINPKLTYFGGFRTDFNNTVDIFEIAEDGISLNPTFWHYLHLSNGFAYNRGSHNLIIGINYGLGLASNYNQPYNITAPTDQNLLQGNSNRTLNAIAHKVSLIVGYTYFISKGRNVNFVPGG